MIKELRVKSFEHVFWLMVLRADHQLAHGVVNARISTLLIYLAKLREAHLEEVTRLLINTFHVYRGHWVLVVRLAVIVKVSTSLVVVQLHRFLAKSARSFFLFVPIKESN